MLITLISVGFSRALWLVSPLVVLGGCSAELAPLTDGSADDDTHMSAPTLSPLANAGADREVLRGYRASLDGRASHHPEGRSFALTWEQLEGTPVFLSNPEVANPTFLAPLDETTLRFRLHASDGLRSTTDEVVLHVRARPSRLAPRVIGVADLVAADPLAASAGLNAVASVSPAGAITTVESITPVYSQDLARYSLSSIADEAPQPSALILRVTAELDGLASAPDYVVVHPAMGSVTGAQAPIALVSGPELAVPGAVLTLSAAGSTDVNGDALTYRWEQVGGEPLQLVTSTKTELVVTAPARATELVFRLVVSDGKLASMPAERRVVIRAESVSTPLAAGRGADLFTRPGRTMTLDAGAPALITGNGDVSYAWEQTFGALVPLETESDGRTVHFDAPATTGDLAFAVVGHVHDLESEPAVVRVRIAKDDENQAPTLALCASTLAPGPNQVVTLAARIIDPEGDVLLTPSVEVTDAQVAPTGNAAGADSLAQLCGSSPVGGSGEPQLFTRQLTTPTTSGMVTVVLGACDDRGACSEATLELDVQ